MHGNASHTRLSVQKPWNTYERLQTHLRVGLALSLPGNTVERQ